VRPLRRATGRLKAGSISGSLVRRARLLRRFDHVAGSVPAQVLVVALPRGAGGVPRDRRPDLALNDAEQRLAKPNREQREQRNHGPLVPQVPPGRAPSPKQPAPQAPGCPHLRRAHSNTTTSPGRLVVTERGTLVKGRTSIRGYRPADLAAPRSIGGTIRGARLGEWLVTRLLVMNVDEISSRRDRQEQASPGDT
jgi:hypothetical protein